jgi:hypothetical protein
MPCYQQGNGCCHFLEVSIDAMLLRQGQWAEDKKGGWTAQRDRPYLKKNGPQT